MYIVNDNFAYESVFRMMIIGFTLVEIIRVVIECIKKKKEGDYFSFEDIFWAGLVYFSGSVGITSAYFFTSILIIKMWEFMLLCVLIVLLPDVILIASKKFGYKMFVLMCTAVILLHAIGFMILLGGTFIVWM